MGGVIHLQDRGWW